MGGVVVCLDNHSIRYYPGSKDVYQACLDGTPGGVEGDSAQFGQVSTSAPLRLGQLPVGAHTKFSGRGLTRSAWLSGNPGPFS
jgi:hypothetical protein